MSECPTGCGRQLQPDKMLCAPCWSRVPAPLQRDVYAAWRILKPLRARDDLPKFRAAVAGWRAAREAALAAIA